jgi:hypothetical protein
MDRFVVVMTGRLHSSILSHKTRTNEDNNGVVSIRQHAAIDHGSSGLGYIVLRPRYQSPYLSAFI